MVILYVSFQSWMTEMQEDYKIQLPKTQILHERLDNLPPVRGSDSCVPIGQVFHF